MTNQITRIQEYIEEKHRKGVALSLIMAGVAGWMEQIAEGDPNTTSPQVLFTASDVVLIIDKLAEITREEEIG